MPAQTEAQKRIATTGRVTITIGLFIGAICTLVTIQAPRHDGKAAEWVGFVAMVGFLVTIGCLYSGIRALYDSSPIPDDPMRAPAPLQLTEGEPWRRPTALRFLEKLKKELIDIETQVRHEYDEAVKAYKKLPHSSGRIEYDRNKRTLGYAGNYVADAQDRLLPPLRERIEKVFAGDVATEILDIDENVKKFQRNKQERERELRAAEAPCKISHQSDDQVQRCERERESLRQRLRQMIHEIDFRVIELETDLKELRGFDFKRLYREMGLTGPPGLLHLETAHLQDIKTKADLINTIPQIGPKPEAPAAPRRSKDEEDIGRIVSTIDSIDGLKKAWTRKKQNSPPEQHELIDRLFRKAIDARLEKL